MIRLPAAVALLAMFMALLPLPAAAQNPGYFIPGQPHAAPRPRPRPATRPPPPAEAGRVPGGQLAEPEQPIPQMPMPPVPDLPALPKTAPPPAVTFGVIDVPDVLRASSAAREVDKEIGARREKLNADSQHEQTSWRQIEQTLASQRSTMSPEQIRTRERELQERITSAQRQFHDRYVIILEAAQVASNQIQAELIAVIRQVAAAHGMNLVLHRANVALNVAGFDITEEVAGQLNKLLPTVKIPPDGVSPLAKAPAAGKAPAAAAPKK